MQYSQSITITFIIIICLILNLECELSAAEWINTVVKQISKLQPCSVVILTNDSAKMVDMKIFDEFVEKCASSNIIISIIDVTSPASSNFKDGNSNRIYLVFLDIPAPSFDMLEYLQAMIPIEKKPRTVVFFSANNSPPMVLQRKFLLRAWSHHYFLDITIILGNSSIAYYDPFDNIHIHHDYSPETSLFPNKFKSLEKYRTNPMFYFMESLGSFLYKPLVKCMPYRSIENDIIYLYYRFSNLSVFTRNGNMKFLDDIIEESHKRVEIFDSDKHLYDNCYSYDKRIGIMAPIIYEKGDMDFSFKAAINFLAFFIIIGIFFLFVRWRKYRKELWTFLNIYSIMLNHPAHNIMNLKMIVEKITFVLI